MSQVTYAEIVTEDFTIALKQIPPVGLTGVQFVDRVCAANEKLEQMVLQKLCSSQTEEWMVHSMYRSR